MALSSITEGFRGLKVFCIHSDTASTGPGEIGGHNVHRKEEITSTFNALYCYVLDDVLGLK